MIKPQSQRRGVMNSKMSSKIHAQQNGKITEQLENIVVFINYSLFDDYCRFVAAKS